MLRYERYQRPIQVGGNFNGYRMVMFNFYAKDGGAWGGTHLNQGDFFRDLVYFPLPSSLDGVLTLVIQGEGMSQPLEVGFEVPHKHKKNKKK